MSSVHNNRTHVCSHEMNAAAAAIRAAEMAANIRTAMENVTKWCACRENYEAAPAPEPEPEPEVSSQSLDTTIEDENGAERELVGEFDADGTLTSNGNVKEVQVEFTHDSNPEKNFEFSVTLDADGEGIAVNNGESVIGNAGRIVNIDVNNDGYVDTVTRTDTGFTVYLKGIDRSFEVKVDGEGGSGSSSENTPAPAEHTQAELLGPPPGNSYLAPSPPPPLPSETSGLGLSLGNAVGVAFDGDPTGTSQSVDENGGEYHFYNDDGDDDPDFSVKVDTNTGEVSFDLTGDGDYDYTFDPDEGHPLDAAPGELVAINIDTDGDKITDVTFYHGNDTDDDGTIDAIAPPEDEDTPAPADEEKIIVGPGVDINEDGKPDVILSNGHFSVTNGEKTIVSEGLTTIEIDVDGDGDDDTVRRTGNNTFTVDTGDGNIQQFSVTGTGTGGILEIPVAR